MKQSMLAMLALMILTTISFNQQRSTAHSLRQMMRNEITTVAAGKLAEKLDLLGGVPFDQLDDLPATQNVVVEAMGTTLQFEMRSEVRSVALDAASGEFEAAGPGSDYKQVTLWIWGPTDASDAVALTRDADGRGTTTMQRVYARLGNN